MLDRDQIVNQLANDITDDRELLDILLFLGQNDEFYQGIENSEIWKALGILISIDIEALSSYAKEVATGIDREVKSATIDELSQTAQNSREIDVTALLKRGSIGFARSWNALPTTARARLYEALQAERQAEKHKQCVVASSNFWEKSMKASIPKFDDWNEIRKPLALGTFAVAAVSGLNLPLAGFLSFGVFAASPFLNKLKKTEFCPTHNSTEPKNKNEKAELLSSDLD